jgi:hypothetical protein
LEVAGPAAFLTPFISYSHADKTFAMRLDEALERREVRCWRDEKGMRPGDVILEALKEAIQKYDKLLLVCSEYSLNSPWVKYELKLAFKKERARRTSRGRQPEMVVPLLLDGAIFSDASESGHKVQLQRRLAVDFRGTWESAYQAQLLRKVTVTIGNWWHRKAFEKKVDSLLTALNRPDNTSVTRAI